MGKKYTIFLQFVILYVFVGKIAILISYVLKLIYIFGKQIL